MECEVGVFSREILQLSKIRSPLSLRRLIAHGRTFGRLQFKSLVRVQYNVNHVQDNFAVAKDSNNYLHTPVRQQYIWGYIATSCKIWERKHLHSDGYCVLTHNDETSSYIVLKFICMYIPVWVGASTLGIRLSIASTTGTATCNNFVISEKKKQEKSIAYSQESQVCFQFVYLP